MRNIFYYEAVSSSSTDTATLLNNIISKTNPGNQIMFFMLNNGGYLNSGIGYIIESKDYGFFMVFGYDHVRLYAYQNKVLRVIQTLS